MVQAQSLPGRARLPFSRKPAQHMATPARGPDNALPPQLGVKFKVGPKHIRVSQGLLRNVNCTRAP